VPPVGGAQEPTVEGDHPMLTLTINGEKHQVDVDPVMPLLWVIRDVIGLRGTKFGCGIGACGACTVHVGGEAARSCITSVGDVADQEITTIEGLSADGTHPVQRAWVANNVPQCGYCQPGQMMQAASLLKDTPKPTDQQITDGMSGNICRCGTYVRIRAAIKSAAEAI
jgi:isoquinoline 1-oxidoreductase alpha subunit